MNADLAQPRTWAGRLAAVWALAFAALHLYWAAGGDLGLAASAGPQLAHDRPAWFVAIGLWTVAGLLIIAGLIAIALTRPSRSATTRRLLLAAAWAACVLLLLRAVPTLVQDLLLECRVLPLPATTDWSVIHWRLALWTLWFLLGATLFALAIRHHEGLNRAS